MQMQEIARKKPFSPQANTVTKPARAYLDKLFKKFSATSLLVGLPHGTLSSGLALGPGPRQEGVICLCIAMGHRGWGIGVGHRGIPVMGTSRSPWWFHKLTVQLGLDSLVLSAPGDESSINQY